MKTKPPIQSYLSNLLKIRKLISSIRDSHPCMLDLYRYGQCYNFSLILKSQFPSGELYYNHIEGHMYFYYLKRLWDIKGEHLKWCPSECRPYTFGGDPAFRWGKRDTRILVCKYSLKNYYRGAYEN